MASRYPYRPAQPEALNQGHDNPSTGQETNADPRRPRSLPPDHSSRSSALNQSDESSIYNATRASTVTEDNPQTCGSGNQINDFFDEGVAANMAMFVPPTPEPTDPPVRQLRYFPEPNQAPWLRRPAFSDGGHQTGMSLPNDFEDDVTIEDLQRRDVASLNDVDDHTRTPNWSTSHFSPVRPFSPRFPPPARSPTPPGLPSFGTPEAMTYSNQFVVRSTNGQAQQHEQVQTGESPRTGDSGPTTRFRSLRRMFSLNQTAEPRGSRAPPNSRQSSPVARAEDGTAVQGRFPYRNSGHGVSVARRLEDHPFHRRLLPIAQCDDSNDDHQSTTDRSSKEGCSQAEPSVSPVQSNLSRLPTVDDLPSIPRPAFAHPPGSATSSGIFVTPRGSFPTPIRVIRVHRINNDSLNAGSIGTVDPNAELFPPYRPSRLASTTVGEPIAEEPLDAHEPPFLWADVWETVSSYFTCCSGQRVEPDDATARTSNDTYITAISHISAERPPQVHSNTSRLDAASRHTQDPRQHRQIPRTPQFYQNDLMDPMLV